jgi:hypothetical protein
MRRSGVFGPVYSTLASGLGGEVARLPTLSDTLTR